MSASSGVPDVACTKPKFTFPDLQLRDHGVPTSETSWPRHYHDETVAPRLERQPGGAHSPAGLFLVVILLNMTTSGDLDDSEPTR